jgi:hypothetical protein
MTTLPRLMPNRPTAELQPENAHLAPALIREQGIIPPKPSPRTKKDSKKKMEKILSSQSIKSSRLHSFLPIPIQASETRLSRSRKLHHLTLRRRGSR